MEVNNNDSKSTLIKQISTSIENGIRGGYSDYLQVTDNLYGIQSMTEYFLTVEVAKAIYRDLNYKVLPEHNFQYLYENISPSTLWSPQNIFDDMPVHGEGMTEEEKIHKTQRVDLVVLKKGDDIFHTERAISCIELKAINKPDNSIITDVRRLSDFMMKEPPTGTNIYLTSCFSVFLRRFDKNEKWANEDEIKHKKNKFEENFSTKLSDIEIEYQKLNYELSSFDIDVNYSDQLDDSIFEPEEYMTRAIYGYMVTITRKPSPSCHC